MSEESSSESETSASSSKFDPIKVLYSDKVKVPVKSAPLYETVHQFETSLQRRTEIIPVGQGHLVQKREEEKAKKKKEAEQALQDKNKRRFEKFEGLVTTTKEWKTRNVLTRMPAASGPLGTLKECVDHRLRLKVITRKDTTIRGVLHATLVAFDKQWNLALTDVLEIWKRKAPKKRKVPPGLGTPVAKGTAASISPVPVVTETPLGGGIWECTRYLPQLMVRGEHVVLINVVER